jgi:hypothetical protein
MRTVTVPKGWAETCGTHSLEGLLAEAQIYNPQPITLEFEREPLSDKGPGILLTPDFAMPEFARSLLGLAHQGYEITITEVHRS